VNIDQEGVAVSEKARQDASGLMQAGSRKNIYAISEVVPDTDDFPLGSKT
jgi:hypothetical protein